MWQLHYTDSDISDGVGSQVPVVPLTSLSSCRQCCQVSVMLWNSRSGWSRAPPCSVMAWLGYTPTFEHIAMLVYSYTDIHQYSNTHQCYSNSPREGLHADEVEQHRADVHVVRPVQEGRHRRVRKLIKHNT